MDQIDQKVNGLKKWTKSTKKVKWVIQNGNQTPQNPTTIHGCIFAVSKLNMAVDGEIYKNGPAMKNWTGTDTPTETYQVAPTKFPAIFDDGASVISEQSKHGFMRFW
jgi:hypothetical protein